MTLSEFLIKYNGKYCEVAGSSDALNQCVDLANAYLRDVLGQPIVEWTNAIDFPSKLTDKFDYILNTPDNFPEEGDLVISGVSYGHIGVALKGADKDHFHSFDENYPIGSFCTVVEHNYNSPKVHGWLRLKEQSSIDCETLFKEATEDRNKHWNTIIQIADILQKEHNPTILIEEITKLVKIEDVVREKDRQLEEASKKITTQETQIKELGEQFSVLDDLYEQSKAEFGKKSDEFIKQINESQKTIEQLKKDTSEASLDGWNMILRGISKLLGVRT